MNSVKSKHTKLFRFCDFLKIPAIFSCFTAWQTVKCDLRIPFDLENNHLQIKTDSITGSYDWINIWSYTDADVYIGAVRVIFNLSFGYWIDYCMDGDQVLPIQPPDDIEKIWTFAKTSTALTISCNEVEVLKYVFSAGFI